MRDEKKVIVLLATLLAALLSGCVQPERMRGFYYARNGIDAEPKEKFVLPEEVQPQFAETETKIGQVEAGGRLELTVEEAMVLALENNQDLRVRQFGPVIAGTFEEIERGVFDAELFGELQVNREESVGTDRNGVATDLEQNGHDLAVGVRQFLPSGTSIEGAVEQSGTDTIQDTSEERARIGISVTQALLRGAGPLVNLVSVRQASLETAASLYELRGVAEALLAATETAYWEYVLAGQEIDIVERSLTIARQQLDEIEQRIEVGVLPQIETAAAKSEVARREQNLIDARSTLEEKKLLLVRLLNPAGDGRLDHQIDAVSGAFIAPVPVSDLEERLQLAEKFRPDLAEARLRLRQNRLETIVTQNGLLPRLDLFITLGKSGYADAFGDSFRNLDDRGYDLAAGIRLSHFLDNRQAKARHLASAAASQQAEEAVENLRQIVNLDVRLAVNEVERTRQLIDATRVTRILQEETLKAEEERFDVGASTALLVAQAQRDLLASAIVEVEAVVDYRKALVNLYLTEGSLLERRGVSVASPR